jgi:hypothetical protein
MLSLQEKIVLNPAIILALPHFEAVPGRSARGFAPFAVECAL